MKVRVLRIAAILPALFLFFLFMPMGVQTADASMYYYFKTPADGASYTVGDKIPISFYAGVTIKVTNYSAAGTPSSTSYKEMPVTLRVFKGSDELYSKEFTYTSGTTIETSYTPTTSGTLKLRIYGLNLGLNATEQVIQDTISIKVKKKKASAVKKIKPKISVERTGKKEAEITCTNDSGFGMKVYRATKKKGKYKLVKTTSKSTYTDKKLSKKKTYYYKIRLYAKSGKKKYVSKWSAKKKAGKFKPGITLSYSKSKGVKVSWQKIKGVGYYLVARNTKGPKEGYDIISCEDKSTTTFYDKDVVKGKTYYYMVIGEVGNDETVVGKYYGNAYKIKIPK